MIGGHPKPICSIFRASSLREPAAIYKVAKTFEKGATNEKTKYIMVNEKNKIMHSFNTCVPPAE